MAQVFGRGITSQLLALEVAFGVFGCDWVGILAYGLAEFEKVFIQYFLQRYIIGKSASDLGVNGRGISASVIK